MTIFSSPRHRAKSLNFTVNIFRHAVIERINNVYFLIVIGVAAVVASAGIGLAIFGTTVVLTNTLTKTLGNLYEKMPEWYYCVKKRIADGASITPKEDF